MATKTSDDQKTPRTLVAASLAVIIVCAAVLAALQYHGMGNRVAAGGVVEAVVDAPQQAVLLWQAKGVKGRTLLLFDSYPHMRGRYYYEGEPHLAEGNFVEHAVFSNLVRRIYLLVPEEAWDRFSRRKEIGALRPYPGAQKGLYLSAMSGIPFVALTPSSLPAMDEKALVYVNGALFDHEAVQELLGRKKISYDIMAVYRGRN